MKNKLRVSTLALACVLAITCGPALVCAADALIDTSRLPRVGGGKEVYASPAQTIFTTTQSVAAATEAVRGALTAQGWQAYEPPFTSKSTDPNIGLLSLKKGAQALSVFITVAPAQNNATNVQYALVNLETDLPFPADAENIEFAPGRPYLKAITRTPAGAAFLSIGEQLVAQGWSAWSTKTVSKIPAGEPIGDSTDKGGHGFFVRDGKPPVILIALTRQDGRTQIEINPIPSDDLDPRIAREREAAARAKEAADKQAAQEAAQKRFAQRAAEFDAKTDDIIKQTLQRATAPQPDAKTPPKMAEGEKPLQALADNSAPVPVPETAESLDFKGDKGRLEFNSASSVAALADFYRNSLKPLGWKEQKSVINRANMVVLDFQKDRKKLSFTIMQMGPKVNVSGDGSGLVTMAAADDELKARASKSSTPIADQVLEAEDSEGLPVPKEHTISGKTQTPFRIEANATVSANVNSVVAFYRTELLKKNWKEDAGADIKPDRAVVKFTSPEGPAILTVDRKDSDTNIVLAVRKQADAAKSGLLPKPGQVKLLISSMLDTDSVLTINKKTIKVGAGVGTKAPDGPTLEVPPGKYKFSIKVGPKPAINDEIEVGADAVWGLMIGPGGALPMQVY